MAIAGDPAYICLMPFIKDALKDWRMHVCLKQGVWVYVLEGMDPIVWQVEWHPEIRVQMSSPSNQTGTLYINNLKLSGLVLGWLMLEWDQGNIRTKHIGMFCDKVSAVNWAAKLRTSRSIATACLLRVLGLRMHVSGASLLTPLSIQRAINNGTTHATTKAQAKYWHHWKQYACQWKKSSFLDDASELECGIILTAFVARVRTGFYSQGNQVHISLVKEALLAISKTIQLAQKQSPVYREDKKYILPVKICVEGMK
eukprot:12692930-Ditylum_brightwellii.AAC.2